MGPQKTRRDGAPERGSTPHASPAQWARGTFLSKVHHTCIACMCAQVHEMYMHRPRNQPWSYPQAYESSQPAPRCSGCGCTLLKVCMHANRRARLSRMLVGPLGGRHTAPPLCCSRVEAPYLGTYRCPEAIAST